MSVTTERPRAALTTGGTTPRNEVSMLFKSTLPLRFWSKVYADEAGCWLWTGAISSGTGYGNWSLDGKTLLAHRSSYSDLVGLPDRPLTLDHLCRVRHCVNALRHLEPVTNRENILRGIGPSALEAKRDACGKGHPYEAGTFSVIRNRRVCLTCRADRFKRKWADLAFRQSEAARKENWRQRKRISPGCWN